MKIYENVVNGTESTADQSPLFIALVNFYQAFNQRNLALMERNWLNSDEISMSNPLGGIRRGWTEIRPVYERIFNGSAQVYVEFYDFTLCETAEMFCAAGRERGFFEVDNQKIELAIRTSRIYLRRDGDWRQIHHHGSIENPALLKQYQELVKGK